MMMSSVLRGGSMMIIINSQLVLKTKSPDRTEFTFIRKNVIEVNRSTVDFKSCIRSTLDEGKLFYGREEKPYVNIKRSLSKKIPTRYMDKSIRIELCNWSSNFINLSFWIRRNATIEIIDENESNERFYSEIRRSKLISSWNSCSSWCMGIICIDIC